MKKQLPKTTTTVKLASKPARVEAARIETEATAPTLSTKTRNLIEGVREPFTAFADGFSQIRVNREELAPKFMRAFEAWAKETGGSFVEFARVLDTDIPEDRDGYRNHPSYQAATYLRRLETASRDPQADVPEDERPATAYVALARLIATVLPIVDSSGAIWTAFVREMHWSEQQAERLRVAGAKEGPVRLPPTVKHRLVAAAA